MSGSAVLWRVGEAGYEQCSVADGTIMWFQQSSGGLVLPDQSLSFGHNYFISECVFSNMCMCLLHADYIYSISPSV